MLILKTDTLKSKQNYEAIVWRRWFAAIPNGSEKRYLKVKNHTCFCTENTFKYFDFFIPVHLVDRNEVPNGQQLLNSRSVGRHEPGDIIALAAEIQNASVAVRNTTTGKLSLILDQVIWLTFKFCISRVYYYNLFRLSDTVPSIASAKDYKWRANKSKSSCDCM